MQKNIQLIGLIGFLTCCSLSVFSKTYFPQDTVFEDVWMISDTIDAPPLILRSGTVIEFYVEGDKKRRIGRVDKITSDGFTINRKAYRLDEIVWINQMNSKTHTLSNWSLPIAALSFYLMVQISNHESSVQALDILLGIIAIGLLIISLQALLLFTLTKTIFRALVDRFDLRYYKKPFTFKKSKLPKK